MGRSQSGNDFDIEVEPDNRIRFYPCGGAGAGGYPGSTTLVQTGRWYHVSATYRANVRMELFINGVKEAEVPIGCTLRPNDSPLTIGWSPIWGRPFHGRIDQVRLFSRALSPAEIQDVYSAEAPGLGTPPLRIRASQVELCWATEKGVSYQLQYASVLTGNLWVPMGPEFIPGSGGDYCTNDLVRPGEPQRFYRLVVVPATSGRTGRDHPIPPAGPDTNR